MVQEVKNPPVSTGDTRDAGSIPGSGRSTGEGDGSPLQYPCLENSLDRGAWRATVHGVTKSQTKLTMYMPHTIIYLVAVTVSANNILSLQTMRSHGSI